MLKLFIISVILVAFVVLALGIKLWLDPKAEFNAHSCSAKTGDLDENGYCPNCQVKVSNHSEKEFSDKSSGRWVLPGQE